MNCEGGRDFILSGETWCVQVSETSIRQRGKHVVHRSMGEGKEEGGGLIMIGRDRPPPPPWGQIS